MHFSTATDRQERGRSDPLLAQELAHNTLPPPRSSLRTHTHTPETREPSVLRANGEMT